MADTVHRPRAAVPEGPPVAGMPAEVWSWLRESLAVRPQVVARVKEALDRGDHATPDQVACAILGDRFDDAVRAT